MFKIPWMNIKHLLFTFIVIAGLAACSSNNRRFIIIGNISGLPVQTVILEQLTANDMITIVDSERSKADGHFEVSGLAPEPGLYRLHFNNNKFILLSVDKGNLKVTGDWNALENYAVAGSRPSEHLKNFVDAIRNHLCDFNTMSVVLDTLRLRGNDSVTAAAKQDFMNMKQQFTQYVERYADTTPYEPNAIFAARMLNPASESDFLSAFSQSLGNRFPARMMTHDFTEYYAKIIAKQHPVKSSGLVVSGTVAPEISLPDTTGKTLPLSSLRGKYVLIDFWASWCNPCRGENPFVVSAYNRFKDKNFTVYSVSLDNNKAAWLKAIDDDHLTWTHVSDLKGWSNVAALAYSVESIPSNYLVDPDGKIIATNLHGNHIEEVLQKILIK